MQEKNKKINGFSERLIKLMEAKEIKPAWVAGKLGISRGAMTNYINEGRIPIPIILVGMAKLLDTTPEYLAFGTTKESTPPNVSRAPVEFGSSVPVISWAHAGRASDYEEIAKDWQEQFPYKLKDPKTFGVIIEGDSMEPDYRHGDIVFVTPSLFPHHGNKVIARIPDGVVFKILKFAAPDGALARFESLNPKYQPITVKREQISWMFPVEGSFRREK